MGTARAHTGGVSLQDPEDGRDAARADARPDGGAAGGRVGRRHVRVGAVVDVEQRALRTLQQDRLAALECLVQQQPRIGDAVLEALSRPSTSSVTAAGSSALRFVDLGEDLVLDLQCGLDLLAEQLLVEHVGGANAHARDLVLVAGADATTGGADLGIARKRSVTLSIAT